MGSKVWKVAPRQKKKKKKKTNSAKNEGTKNFGPGKIKIPEFAEHRNVLGERDGEDRRESLLRGSGGRIVGKTK